MSKWHFLCSVRQIVCDKVSRTFYDNNSDEILEHFGKFEEDELEISDEIKVGCNNYRCKDCYEELD